MSDGIRVVLGLIAFVGWMVVLDQIVRRWQQRFDRIGRD